MHLGLGAFCRSHTAWYTANAEDAAEWGIAAYAGRSRDLADRLAAQDGLYTLIQRDASGDAAAVIESISRAHAGDDITSLVADLAAPQTAVVTLTITEAGYRIGHDDQPDWDDALVARDVAELRAVTTNRLAPGSALPATALGRLLLGLEARRRGGSGSVTIMSCDNLPDNGGRLGRCLSAWALSVAPELHRWMTDHVAYASSSVDRITPQISASEAHALSARYGDLAPVVTEPFRDWVIRGSFPAGRPKWEAAGARFVDDLEPWEARKLWMLNGAHTLLACLGLRHGYTTVAEAIADVRCRAMVNALWDEAEAVLPSAVGAPGYRAALLDRFANPRIEHRLWQIAQDTATKMRVRVAPIAEANRARGHAAAACAHAFAAWIAAARENRLPLGSDHAWEVEDFVLSISPVLATDAVFIDAVRRSLSGSPSGICNESTTHRV